MNEGIIMLVVVAPIATVLTYMILVWKSNRARAYMEDYIETHRLDLRVVKAGIPPLRLWLFNRKGDLWAQVESSHGVTQWARIRHRIFSSGDPVEFFD